MAESDKGFVLIVEDETGLAELLAKRLGRAGYASAAAHSAEEALEAVRARCPDLLLVDYSLPGKDGLQFVEAAAAQMREKGCRMPPFIVTTGRGDERLAVEIMKRGAADYIVKDGDFLTRLQPVIERAVKDAARERELEEAREQFRQVVEFSNIAISLTMADGQVRPNQALCDLLGYSREELSKLNWRDITPPEDIPVTQAVLAPLLAGKTDRARLEKRYQRKDGSVVWGDVGISVHRGPAGRLEYFITSVTDITQRKKAEEELRHSAETVAAQLEFQSLLTEVQAALLAVPLEALDREIKAAQRRLCLYFGAERTALWLGSPHTPGRLVLSHLVALDAGRTVEPGVIVNDVLPWLSGRLLRGEEVRFPDVEALPPEAADDLAVLRAGGVKSTFSVPFIAGTVRGALSFSVVSRKADWPPETMERARLAAQLFAGVLTRRLYEEERRQAEQKAGEMDELLRLAGRAASFGGWRVDLDTMTAVWSDEVAALHDMPAGFSPSVRGAIDFYIPEHRPLISRAVQDCIAYGRSFDLQLEILTAKGRRRWVRAIGQAQRGADGQVKKISGAFQDITEKLESERENARLAAAMDQAAEMMVVTDREGAIVYVNPAFEKVTGYLRSEALGRKPSLLKSGRQDAMFYQEMWATVTSGHSWSGRMVNRRKDGTLYTEESVISPVRGQDGEICNFVAVKRDISAEISMEEQLRQSQKMEAVGLLAGGVAHDFNNILTAIKLNAELVRKTFPAGDARLADMEEVLTSAERATNLTRQLLAFSRRQIMAPKVVDINEVSRGINSMLRRLVGEQVKIEMRLAPEPLYALVDPAQFEQVLLNLAVNARDAMPEGGTITLESGGAPGSVWLKVSDTGCGMSEDVQARLFEPFFTTKELGKGTGLGLSTVFGILKQCGGGISVDSEPGRGSAFRCWLPRVEQPAAHEEPAVKGRQDGGRELLLVVEDEESLRRIAERVLKGAGYKVSVAENGEAALRIARGLGRPLDMLVTDVIMPGMTGRELAQKLAAEGLATRVLFMSGHAEAAIVNHGVLDEGVAFIYKPFAVEAFLGKVRETLDGPADKARP